MKTIEINLYSFDELNDTAKQKAIKDQEPQDNSYIYDDAYKTVQAFNDLFKLKEGHNSWLDSYTDNIDDNQANLKGLRLRTFIINNFWNSLYKGKYFSLWSKTEKSYKHYKEGYPVLKSRYSKVMFKNSYALTGMCYDDTILQPIYEFLDWKLRPDYNSYMNFETLINDCFENLKKAIEEENDYLNSDAAKEEHIQENEYQYTIEGEKYLFWD